MFYIYVSLCYSVNVIFILNIYATIYLYMDCNFVYIFIFSPRVSIQFSIFLDRLPAG